MSATGAVKPYREPTIISYDVYDQMRSALTVNWNGDEFGQSRPHSIGGLAQEPPLVFPRSPLNDEDTGTLAVAPWGNTRPVPSVTDATPAAGTWKGQGKQES